MGFLETLGEGLHLIVTDAKEWWRTRNHVTDQEQARIERAEIEAKREGQRKALNEYIEEHKLEVTEEEKERYLEQLRGNQSPSSNLLGGMNGEPEMPFATETDTEPQLPGFGDSDLEPQLPGFEADDDTKSNP